MKYPTDTLEESVPKPPAARCPLHDSVRQLLQVHCQEDKSTVPSAAAQAQTSRPLPRAGFSIAIYRRAAELPAYWDRLCADNQVFLKKEYLKCVEAYPPAHYGFAYAVFLRQGEAVGVAACQLANFNLARNVQHLQRLNPELPRWRQWVQQLRLWFARRANFHLLVCGAAQATGQHAYHFSDSLMSPKEQLMVLQDGLEVLSHELCRQGWPPQAVLIKDFYEEGQAKAMRTAGYHLFPFMPNLILRLRPEWTTFEDYLNAMVSKYRVRARRAFKKAKAVDIRPMSLADMAAAQERMYELYLGVVRSADFSLLQLSPGYFAALKRTMGDDFTVLGYYEEGELIGFCSALRNGTELEAHFLGFDNAHNYKHQLYLNMLYDIVRLGIEEFESETIVFSRTATEIKTSVGAEPVPMQAFMRYRCGLLNRLLPVVIRQFETAEGYQQRHPFGKE
jgi:hypothetical protein